MGNTEIKLTLTVDQVNVILQGLSNMPFGQVVDLISVVRNQATAQIPVAPQEVEVMSH